MSCPPSLKPDDPAQSKWFLDLAKEFGADGLEASIQRLGQHAPEPRRKVGKQRKRPSK